MAIQSALGQIRCVLKKGITDSREYVKVVIKKIKQKKFKVRNISIAVEAKIPRLPLKLVEKMKKEMGTLLEISSEKIGITFTSGENLTPFGRGEAIQVFTVVLLEGGEKND